MKKISFVFMILMLLVTVSHAQHIDSIVNRTATRFFNEKSKVGLSIGIIKDDQIYQYHFGSIEKGKSNLPNKETIYEIGSITKTFTSMLLAQAVMDKKVDLSDDIRKYLKGNYPNLEFKGKPIRLVHLANLTSGLPDNLPEKMPPFKSSNRDSQLLEIREVFDQYTKAQFLKDLHEVKLVKEPGSNPSHSNTAAQLMGFLLENIYGEDYSELLKRYITGPLNMNRIFVSVPVSLKKDEAKGYNNKGLLMPEIPKGAGSAGVLKSTLPDMVKYIHHQLKEKDKRVVLGHTVKWGSLDNSAIGLNWWVKTNFDDKRKITASGGTFGFSSYSVQYPERRFAVVILSNENDGAAENALATIADTIYSELYFTSLQRSSIGFGFSKAINTLLEALNKRGFEHAIEIAKELKQKDASFKLNEDELNVFGYRFLYKGNQKDALEIFKLNVNLHPQSANTYDSLAETYEGIGDKQSAIKYYKRALELDPSSTNAAEHLKKLEK